MTELDFSKMDLEEIEKTLARHKIALTPKEALKIQDILGRAPTVTEAVIWGIQGSEHCSYKSSKKYLKGLPTDGSYVMLGPSEDAGIIEIAQTEGKKYGIVIAHESHNHPSQVVPYEGAATGIGGIVRDVMCMGAKVVATADPLRFGEIERPKTKLIAGGVIDGIAGYGNPIGVPNIAGDVYFNHEYNDNCLVNVVAMGLVREDEILRSRAPENAEGHAIIVVGKPTDLSGFGGAALASFELNEEDKEANKGAVQEPNPFLKRHLLSATYDLFELLKESGRLSEVGFKDHGAGGNVCASVEMVEAGGYGAEIDLEKVPVAMNNLPPYVIACSETQERLMWIVPQDLKEKVLDHYNVKWDLPDIAKGARAAEIGKVIKENKYIIRYKGAEVVNVRPCDITEGILYDRKHSSRKISQKEVHINLSGDEILKVLEEVVSHENIASRKPFYENYDKNVQGISVIESGEADAGVIAPLLNRFELEGKPEQMIGIALSVDANPRYGCISAKRQAELAVMEGMRNVAAVGATPWCITDCLNYGSPEDPVQMGELIDGIEGIKEALGQIPFKIKRDESVPVISGNVSLYNFSKSKSIPPSAIIGTLGRIENYKKCVKLNAVPAESYFYLLGNRRNELGGSVLFNVLDKPLDEGLLPTPDYENTTAEIFSVIDAIDRELLLACHDISDGGLVTAFLEMLFQNELGVECVLPLDLINLSMTEILFGENGGFICQVAHTNQAAFEDLMSENKVNFHLLGKSKLNSAILKINDLALPVLKLKSLWEEGLRTKLK